MFLSDLPLNEPMFDCRRFKSCPVLGIAAVCFVMLSLSLSDCAMGLAWMRRAGDGFAWVHLVLPPSVFCLDLSPLPENLCSFLC